MRNAYLRAEKGEKKQQEKTEETKPNKRDFNDPLILRILLNHGM